MATVAEIAEKLGGKLDGDGGTEITGLADLATAGSGDISFLSNPRYASAVSETGASAVIVNADWEGDCPCAVIRAADPDMAFAVLGFMFGPEPIEYPQGVHETAVVADDVELGADVSIGPHCVVGNAARIGRGSVLVACSYVGHGVVLGEECKLYPYVSIREHCVLGDRVIIHNGAVIGSDGFGYFRDGDAWQKIPQIGIVELGNDVEIGANVTIDRARFGKTVVEDGVKIDNLVQLAHNVKIGAGTAMAALAGVSGSVSIGKNARIGGQSGFSGHITVGDNAVVGAQAGVSKDVKPGVFVSGYPAMPHDKAAKIRAHVMRLPELKKRLLELEKRIESIESQGGRQESGDRRQESE